MQSDAVHELRSGIVARPTGLSADLLSDRRPREPSTPTPTFQATARPREPRTASRRRQTAHPGMSSVKPVDRRRERGRRAGAAGLRRRHGRAERVRVVERGGDGNRAPAERLNIPLSGQIHRARSVCTRRRRPRHRVRPRLGPRPHRACAGGDHAFIGDVVDVRTRPAPIFIGNLLHGLGRDVSSNFLPVCRSDAREPLEEESKLSQPLLGLGRGRPSLLALLAGPTAAS